MRVSYAAQSIHHSGRPYGLLNAAATIATLVAGSADLMAQTGGGATLVGTVRDAMGATVAGAKVTVVNTETAFVTETTTKEDGGYYLPYLAPGGYRLKVTASGFKE